MEKNPPASRREPSFEDLRTAIEALSESVKLLALVTKTVGYASLTPEQEPVDRMTRDVERVSDLADMAMQKLGGGDRVSDVSEDQSRWLKSNERMKEDYERLKDTGPAGDEDS